MPYVVKAGRVTFDHKAVRGADAGTFVEILGGWARDKQAVYFDGNKVSRCAVDHFRPLAPTVGLDHKRIFYRDSRGRMQDASFPIETLDPHDVEVELSGDGVHTYLKSKGGVWALREWLVGIPLDAQSFVPLRSGYAKDQTRVVWLGLNERGAATTVDGADAESFFVDETGAHDRHGTFLCGARASGPLPVQLETEPLAAATALIQSLWQELVVHWFSLFDGFLPNDQWPWTGPTPPASPSAIPEHRLRYQDGWLVLEAQGDSCRGKPQAMELLAGWLWGKARGKTLGDGVCIRVPSNPGRALVAKEGAPPRWQRCLDLAFLLSKLGERQDATLLVQLVLRMNQYGPVSADPHANPRARAEWLLPSLTAKLPAEISGRGSTTQAVMQWLVDEQIHQSSDPLVRLKAAELIGDLVNSTVDQPVRLARIAEPTLVLLDDPEPAVRLQAAASFELLASSLFCRQAYEAALLYADEQAKHGFNLDIVQARRSECLTALDREPEAKEAWAKVEALTSPDERAPRQHAGLHTDFASFAMWRIFSHLRLVKAYRFMANGEHPCEELRRKKVGLAGANLGAETYRKQAQASAAGAVQAALELGRTAPARQIGLIMAEFAEEHALATGIGRIEGMNFVMHKQFVDYRRYGIPFRYQQALVEVAGEFVPTAPHQFAFARATQVVEAKLGASFGIEFRFIGTPVGRVLPGLVTVEQPGEGGGKKLTYPTSIFLGLREQFVWTFQTPEEIVPGPWLIRVEVFDTAPPSSYPVHLLPQPTAKIAAIEQTFTVNRTEPIAW